MSAGAPELFLKVKLIRPPVREQRVPRPRLNRRLDGAFAFPVTLICAPAGYGKTTLLVDWISTRSEPVAWLTLGPEENDAACFLNYFLLALQNANPTLGRLAQMTAVNIPGADTRDSFLRLLVNELSEIEEPLAIVLDDYHRIEAEEVHRMLDTLVEHLPPALHVIFSSRVEPPISLSRLRAKGQVLELRAADLRFQPDEYETFLTRVMALELSPQECQRLGEQTEGWVAGLQLAGLSLLGGEKSIDPLRLGAGQHYIFDYLAEEVLRGQPEPLQTFLLCTSILEQLSGPLCDALVPPFPPYETGSACLDALDHANLFTQALDGEHRWYRYHALFASFLLDRLTRTSPELVPALHRRAAGWLAGQGAYPQAYRHAIAGDDLDLAVRMVEASAEGLEKYGELSLLSEWIAALPEEVVRTRPRLNLSRAWAAISRLEVQKSTAYLDLAEQYLDTGASPMLRGEVLAARAFVAGLMDQSEQAQAFTEQAVRLLPQEGHYLSGLLLLNVCFPMMMSGNLVEVIHRLEDAVFHAQQSKSPFVVLIAMRILGEAYLMVGRLSQSERVFRQALEYIEETFGAHSSLAGVALMGLGEVCRQRNDFARAEKYLQAGIEQTTAWMSAIALDGYIWMASLNQSRGDLAGAQNVIHRAHQIIDVHNHPLLDEWMLDISAVRLDILQGYLDEAQRWARTAGLDLDGATGPGEFRASLPVHFREMAQYVLARLFLVLGRREKVPGALEKAGKILNDVLPESEARGAYAMMLEGLVLMAQVESALGRPQQAQDCLHRALDLGAPERPVRVFLDEGEPLMSLLGERRGLDLPPAERAYLEALWSAWSEEQGGRSSAPAAPEEAWIEPLSRREIEVLRALAEGKSNQEIAARLVLSLNTVKKHVSTIMGKLNAKNRTQAVLLARRLGLLE